MNILLTGGAGYIGSHTAVELINDGHSVIIVDNLANSQIDSIKSINKITDTSVDFYELDVCDKAELDKVFQAHNIDAVIHFAGLKAVGESVAKPLSYYRNNIDSTLSLCEVMEKHNVKKIVFSSSATVYGTPKELPFKETSPTGVDITNPYGQTKYMIEQILRDLSISDDSWQITLLRYFNPIGAHESGLIGEKPNGVPNNLMPYISQVASGQREFLNIFGGDYDTPDGTGVRDYIHIVDLAKGHVAALNNTKPGAIPYNLGSGEGVSVLELISSFEKVTGHKIPYKIVDRRAGDIAAFYSDPSKAKTELNWQTELSLDDACKDSWRWEQQNVK